MIKYLVLLHLQNGKPAPLVESIGKGSEEIALYDSEGKAEKAAQNNPLGALYGYEVIEWEM